MPAAVVSGAEKQHLAVFSSEESCCFSFCSPSSTWGCSQGSASPEGSQVWLCSGYFILFPLQLPPQTQRLQLPAPPLSALNIPCLKLTLTTETTRSILLLFAAAHFSHPGSGQQIWQITECRNNCTGTVLPCSWGGAKATGQLLEAQGISKRQIDGISYSSPTSL